jgi:adenine specific DNA methylase Mod
MTKSSVFGFQNFLAEVIPKGKEGINIAKNAALSFLLAPPDQN